MSSCTAVVGLEEGYLLQSRRKKKRWMVLTALLVASSFLCVGCISFGTLTLVSMALGMANSMGLFGDGKTSKIMSYVSMVGTLVGMVGGLKYGFNKPVSSLWGGAAGGGAGASLGAAQSGAKGGANGAAQSGAKGGANGAAQSGAKGGANGAAQSGAKGGANGAAQSGAKGGANGAAQSGAKGGANGAAQSGAKGAPKVSTTGGGNPTFKVPKSLTPQTETLINQDGTIQTIVTDHFSTG